ncbi:MAG: copper homeostasis protein CutC [Planctomycetes bacterium]|nr:copper homeostasis protein CutC [Planctomycetota bacterium]
MSPPANVRVAVEVAVDSVAGATAAVAAGADRLELCAALLEGGLTPSAGLLAAVKAAVAVPVFAMARPRGGDFLYDGSELDVLLRDVEALRAGGADGIVAGVLTADGAIDGDALAQIRERAGALPLTCHRAIDLTADPFAALATLIHVGCERVLTSGQAASAAVGADRIAELVAAAAGGITVMAGAGVRPDNAAEIVRRTGCRELHLSATAWRASAMRFRRDGVPMGVTAPPGEYARRVTDPDAVAAVVAAVAAAR